MRFTLLALPVFAVAVQAAAISTTTSAVAPATYANTKSAIASILSELAKQAPKAATATTIFTTIIKKATTTSTTTTKISSSTKTPSTTKTSSTTKSPSTTKSTTTAKSASTTKSVTTTKFATTTKSALIATGASTTASAAPAPKGAAPTVVSETKQTVAKRQSDACSAQSKIFDYTPNDKFATFTEIMTNYLADAVLTASSRASVAAPAGYSWVWQSFYAAAENRNYLGWKAMASYDVADCAAACTSVPACRSFNIFYERAPSLVPAAACPNPPAFTAVKCTFFGAALTAKMATNTGQWRERFTVAVTGSNAYVKVF